MKFKQGKNLEQRIKNFNTRLTEVERQVLGIRKLIDKIVYALGRDEEKDKGSEAG